MIALAIGMIGIALPGLPTVPFLILAAFCFARADPRLEQWLVTHPRFGPHIQAWRARGAIRIGAKRLALTMLAASIILSALLLGFPWAILPAGAAVIAGAWIWTRPNG